MAWTAELAIVAGPRMAAWGGRVLNDRGLVVWAGAERWATPAPARAAGLQTLHAIGRSHRVRLAVVHTTPWPLGPSPVPVVPGAVPEAERLARSLMPLAVVAWERLTPTTAVAHGRTDYVVDVARQTCTCPAWRFGRRPCKHLAAVAGSAPSMGTKEMMAHGDLA